VSLSTPPRPPRQRIVVDPSELQALVEALIEEARQRARRRRRRRGAAIVLAVLAGGGLYLGLGRGGGGPSAAPGEHAPTGSAATAARTAVRWGASHGPFGGPVHAVAVAPSAHGVAYVGTELGVFRTTNGGQSWTSAGLARPLGASVSSLVVDPHAPATVYAGLNQRWVGGASYREAVYKTTNGGRTWRPLDLPGQPVAASPAGPPTVYAATTDSRGATRLVRSSDGGRSWRQADAGLPSTYVWGLAFDPSRAGTVYAAMGEPGLFASTDRGAHWHPVRSSLRYGEVTAIALDPSHPRTVYAGTNAGLLVSRDAARSWRVLNGAMGAHGRDRGIAEVNALVVDPLDPSNIYASAFCTGLSKSTDGGSTWTPANAGFKPQCSPTESIALDPRAPQTLYAANSAQGVFTSADGGRHWQAANRGLSLTPISSLAVDPHDSQTVYAGTRALGLFRSRDGGAHWQPLGRERVAGIAVDPSGSGNVLIASPPNGIVLSTDAGRTWTRALGGRAVSVVAIRGTIAYAGVPDGGTLFGSTDAGRNWRPRGRLGGYLEALAIEPGVHGAVYAAVADSGSSKAGGLYKSTDDARTWQRLTDAQVTTVALDPRDRETVYAGVSEGSLLRSTDGGATWHESARLGTVATREIGVTAVAVDPLDTTTLYVAVGRSGVFRSTDAGRSWRLVKAGLVDPRITALGVDPTGRTLYAGTFRGGVVSLPLR
jgi:photosystem II stability/assembly factor-like uncharacterized protein